MLLHKRVAPARLQVLQLNQISFLSLMLIFRVAKWSHFHQTKGSFLCVLHTQKCNMHFEYNFLSPKPKVLFKVLERDLNQSCLLLEWLLGIRRHTAWVTFQRWSLNWYYSQWSSWMPAWTGTHPMATHNVLKWEVQE